MTTSVHVGLASSLRRDFGDGAPARELLARGGPTVAIGGAAGADGLAIPVRPDATTLFGPRGACVAMQRSLWVSDTGHHRLLGWRTLPSGDGVPADWVIGQRDFASEGRNGKRAAGPETLNVPTGVSPCARGLAVADAWNHRVLIWHETPAASNVPADVVLGQQDFASMEANGGGAAPSASTLFWPYGVHFDGARLWVADAGNRRVLMWDGLPPRHGQPADLVLGQRDFTTRDENAGGAPDAASMRWPHAIARWNGQLCVTDAGNSRIMVWGTLPSCNGAPCDVVLGQTNARDVDHNRSLYWPDAQALNMPYGIACVDDWLMAADTANSRLVAWHHDDCATGAAARALAGQPDFHAKGDNRWQLCARDSLCWPYGIARVDGACIVCDSGNNRVLVWPLAHGIDA